MCGCTMRRRRSDEAKIQTGPHQVRALDAAHLVQARQEGDGLEGLAEAHLVGEYAAASDLRGLHSSTFRLDVSAFCGVGVAFKGCLWGFKEVLGVSCWV